MLKFGLRNKLITFLYTDNFFSKLSLTVLKIIRKFNEVLLEKHISVQIQNSIFLGRKISTFNNSIMFVIPNLGPGGSERQITNLINFFDELKDKELFPFEDIILVCFNISQYPNNFYLTKVPTNVKIFDLNQNLSIRSFKSALQKNPKYFWLGFKIFYLNELDTLINDLKPRVINGWLDSASIICGISGKINGVPKIILSGRNMNPSKFLMYRSFMKSAYKSLSLFTDVNFTNNSKAGALDYENWLEFPAGKISVFRNGYQLNEFENINNSIKSISFRNDAIVGGIGRLSHEKDFELWIKTAKELHEINRNVKFIIYGNGPLKTKINRQIKLLGLSHVVSLYSSTFEIYKKMSDFSILLLTSKTEGLPNVLIEAQFLGIPVVSTKAGGSSEAFIDNETGFEILTRDAREIAVKINELLLDHFRYQTFSKNAKIQAKKNFEISQIGQGYINLFNGI